MTTIIAKKDAETGTVTVAWDSQSTGGNSMYHCEKAADVNGQFFIGVGGRARYGDILQYAKVPEYDRRDVESGDFDAKEYLVMEAVPAWIHAVKKASEVHEEREDWPGGAILAVIEGRIFQISHDFSVDEFLDYGGIGSGSDYARGAMAAGATAEEALKIAAELDPYTGGQLQITKGL